MTARLVPDPYIAVIRAFNRVGVQYVVIGMAGINYYARRASEAITTMDYDLFLKPTLPNVQKAVHQLQRLGYALGTASGALEARALRDVVRSRLTLTATSPAGVMVEALLAVSGYTFEAMIGDAATITVQGVPVKVGRLTKLLRSKQIAGRPKDRQFLRRYQQLSEE
ncbi:MAG: hypothetical protein HY597_06170 [Candidatus Omnitrophica bacterium]|nr:hypothetical protein [Candidatus Omnitrophota bacterium]